MTLGLICVAAASSQAQAVMTNYYWTGANADGIWEESGNWILSNNVPATAYPSQIDAGTYDVANFTNSGTYTVSFTPGDTIVDASNFFDSASGTVAVVTLELNGGVFNPFPSDPHTTLAVGEGSNTTSILYLDSSPAPKGYVSSGGTDIGHDGIGTLWLTNGFVQLWNVNVGSGAGQGTIIISGTNAYVTSYQFSVGNTNASYGDTLIVSNSASLTVNSSFRIGSSSSQATSNCQFIVTDGATVSVYEGPMTIGNRATISTQAAYNNIGIVDSGGALLSTNHTMVVGTAAISISGIGCSSCPYGGNGLNVATGNVFTVQAGGFVYGISEVGITPSNTFALYGGTFGGGGTNYAGSITNFGVFQGWGVIMGSLTTASNAVTHLLGYSAISNQVGPLVLSNSLTLVTNAVMQMTLGTNFYPIAVGLGQADAPPPTSLLSMSNSLVLYGTLNFVDSGGFTAPHTYKLITYPANLVTNYGNGLVNSNFFAVAATISNVPNPVYTYTLSTNTPGEIDLIVGCTNCGAPPFPCMNRTTPLPLQVCVSDCSTGSPAISSWEWLWGDGNSVGPGGAAYSNNVCYTYANEGTYVITQIVCNASGCGTNSQSVTVYTPFHTWQNEYFANGTLNASAGPNVDFYATGMSNTNKFLAGFAGNVKGAYLHIISIAKANGTNVVVTFLGSNGDSSYSGGPTARTNRLEYTTGRTNGSYSNNFAQVPGVADVTLSGGVGTGAVTSVTDVGGATNNVTRYYRVRVLAP
jgi:hypothetical protein